jgi:hypothetical protein
MNTPIFAALLALTALTVNAAPLTTRMLQALTRSASSTALVAALEHVQKLDAAGSPKEAGEALEKAMHYEPSNPQPIGDYLE